MKTISNPRGKRLLATKGSTLLLGLILGFCTSVFGSEPNQQWVARYNGPGNSTDYSYALAEDNYGNVYITGYSYSGTHYDYATVKYSSNGNQLWEARYNGPGNSSDNARALTIDNSGNVYVTGGSVGSGTSYDYTTIKYSPDGNELWVARYNGPSNGSDEAYALAVDNSSNVYVTGRSVGSTSLDYTTIKYNSTGNELWVRRYNGDANGNEYAYALAVDSTGNVYVTGGSVGSGGTGYDYATVKYSPSGSQLWVARYNGPANGEDMARAIAVDKLGNVYVTGGSISSTGYDYATVKYSPSGSQLWAKRYNYNNWPVNGTGLAYNDWNGLLYVTTGSLLYRLDPYGGYPELITDSLPWAIGGLAYNSGNGYLYGIDGAHSLYRIDPTYGAAVLVTNSLPWTAGAGLDYDSSNGYLYGTDNAHSLYRIDPANGATVLVNSSLPLSISGLAYNIYDGYLYGTSETSLFRINPTGGGTELITESLPGAISGLAYSSMDYCLYGTNETSFGWIDPFTGYAELYPDRMPWASIVDDYACAMTIDSWGNVCVSGYSYGSGTGNDYATIKYTPEGIQSWVARYNGGFGDDTGRAIALDNSDNVYVTGYSKGSGTNEDYATIKYTPNGNQLWAIRYNGPVDSSEMASALAVDNSGNVYVTGYSVGSGTYYDYATVKYTQQPHCIYVDTSATGANNGSSWVDAYNYLQDALAVAEPNDAIWVAQGIYRPDEYTSYPSGTGYRVETFWLDGVELYGGFPTGGGPWTSRNPNIYKTILSGDLNEDDEPNFVNNGENSYSVVSGDGAKYKILDGFTITAGNGNGEHPYNFGGGMRSGHILTVTNCTFSGNTALEGGGIFNNDSSSNAIITNCKFIGNLANGDGGGIASSSSNLTLTNCTFIGNTAATSYGGGMYSQLGNPTLINCTFIGNSATTYYGGGMCNNSDNNSILTNCTFIGNSANQYGGGIYNCYDSDSTINNCILWDNTAPTGAQIYNDGTSSSAVSFSDVQDGYTGTGNIDENPLLVDANGPDNIVGTEDDNLRLLPGSPCIDAADNNAVPGGTVTDLDGLPRFLDDPVTDDTGNGIPPIVDMGAYEYKPAIYVDASATGANNGSNWEDAYKYLQDALTAVEPNSNYEIWVALSTYRPDEDTNNPSGTGSRTATFQLKNGVAVYGGFPTGGGNWASRDPKVHKTILSGDIAGNDVYVNDPCDLFTAPTRAENSYHVVTGSYTDANTILDGFTITAGNANKPPGGFPYGHGGGMFNLRANCRVNSCSFVENSARFGGGMAGNTDSDYLCVTNCTFLRNDANENGGGIDLYRSDYVVLANCTFIGNFGGINGAGGMSIVSSSSPTLINCTISGNSTLNGYGGGIMDHNSNPTLTNCIIWGNTAPTGAQIFNGGTSSPIVSFSDVQGGYSGTGNIDADPLFIGDTEGHLLYGSPCRNAGDPNGDYSGQIDVDGQTRVAQGRVDIGADELYPPIQNIDTGATYDTIQDAIDAANNGETIVIQPGTYTGAGNRDIDFGGKAITLRGINPDKPNTVAITVIDCQGGPGNLHRGFYFHTNEESNSVVSGIAITNGYVDYGGAIYCNQSNPKISKCLITANTATTSGGGIYCQDSNPTIDGGTIRNNSPDGIYIEADSSVLILGTVHIISNDIVGAGNLQMSAGGSLDLENAHVFCNMSGPGTVTVALGAEATIDGNSIIDLSDPYDPNIKGTIDSKGLLKVKENAQIISAKINVTRAVFEDKAEVKKCEIHVDSNAPYGTSVFAEPNTSFVDVNIYADGDRYMDLEPNIFDGNFVNVKIFVTITEGVGQLQGGLLECRGDVNFADVNSCDPNNDFFCRANTGTIPDCNIKAWTLERLELIPGAKLNLTNRFPFQPPYSGTDYDVVYVKELILRQGSVLNTSFNHIYYDSLIKEPNAVIKNEPLLGFSMINIALDDQTEFIVRVTPNNYTDYNDPNHNRVHIERVEGLSPDPNGMMRMSNLLDLDPCSPDYNDIITARAKGLFSKSSEEEIFIRFEYLFGAVDPNTELVIYLSDIPELGDVNDTNDYIEVARLLPPLPGQAGSVGSGRFGVFTQYVPTNGLNFIRGTRIEFMLLGGNGVYMYINNWDPQAHCTGICLDLNFSCSADEEDFLIVLGNYGTSTESPTYACLEGPFGNDGTVDSGDICGWDWALNSIDRLNCCSVPLIGGTSIAGSSLAIRNKSSRRYQLSGLSGAFDDILVCGKRGTDLSGNKMKDALYVFNNDGQYLNKLIPPSNRANIRLVEDFDGNVHLINSESEYGIQNVDSGEIIVWPAQLDGINELRYGTSATVYVGIQGTGDNSYGRPISDAAFDLDFADNNYIYIVPVVVEPYGEEAYVAAAKLQLSASSYSVIKLYDDPDAAELGDNRNLDALREVEVDTTGNLYVLNAYSNNESDILWKYNASSGMMIERLVLGNSSSVNYVPSPSAMYLSTAQDMLYLASSLNPTNTYSCTIYGFSTSGTLTLERKITVNGMGHVTGITEDPTTGTLWVAGFSMEPPEYPSPDELPFYDPYLAEVPIDSNNVNAICTSSGDPNNDLALPLSIVWTGAIRLQEKCGGADLDSSGDVDLKDFSIFAQHWYESGCVVPDWCGGADLDPYIINRGQVDLVDLAIFVKNWLESDCLE